MVLNNEEANPTDLLLVESFQLHVLSPHAPHHFVFGQHLGAPYRGEMVPLTDVLIERVLQPHRPDLEDLLYDV